MSIMLTGSVKERRHASTMNIDRLSTLDMLNVIHQDDAQISSAITPFLTTIARVVDNAAATLSHGGRLVLVGAGPSGRVNIPLSLLRRTVKRQATSAASPTCRRLSLASTT